MKSFKDNDIIIGIETSCDDTCVSAIRVKKENKETPSFEVISNIVSSQIKIHKKWGGIYPTLAIREHQKKLTIIFNKVLKEIKEIKDIKKIAITTGPGLDPCLWTGINFSKNISKKNKIPLVPVNHIEAHLIISFFNFKKNKLTLNDIGFPVVGLVVSGGHTLLVLIKGIGKYEKIGETRDDAAGECFDKTARILGLGYPGGPAISDSASKFLQSKDSFQINLPRPMIYSKDFDFSFSGLKTAVLYQFKSDSDKINKKYKYEMAYQIQEAITDVLVKKTILAAKKYNAKSIIVGGGVSANKRLQDKFEKETKLDVFFPSKKFRTDNGLMIAVTGFFKKPQAIDKIKSNPNLNF